MDAKSASIGCGAYGCTQNAKWVLTIPVKTSGPEPIDNEIMGNQLDLALCGDHAMQLQKGTTLQIENVSELI